MTAQAGDKFMYEGKEYSLVSKCFCVTPLAFTFFDFLRYKIIPEGTSTACYAGYTCHYCLNDNGLFLEDLHVNSKNGEYPAINGITPSKDLDVHDLHVYKGLNISHRHHSGKFLLGDDFINDFYIHMGFQWPWAYKTLKELVFEDGKLIECTDQSEMAAHLREIIKSYLDLEREIGRHAEECFTTEYFIKSWWLHEGDFILWITRGGRSIHFSFTNPRKKYSGILVRDLIEAAEHPKMKITESTVTSDKIFTYLKRRNFDFSNLRWILFSGDYFPLENTKGFLDFCSKVRLLNANVEIQLSSDHLNKFIKIGLPLKNFEGKIDSASFNVHLDDLTDVTRSNPYKTFFDVESKEEICAFFTELKKYIPDVTVKAYTRHANEETANLCRHIVEDELKVKFEG